MKGNTSDGIIQNRLNSLPFPKKLQNTSKFSEKPSTPQHATKLPLISTVFDEPTRIRRILYHKPEVSAKSWIAINCSTNQQIDGSCEEDPREIASLTKIVTCVVAIQEVFRLKKSFDDLVEVSQTAGGIDGTRAGLCKGDSLRIWDLLHGLMLPSGNDAAIALAEYFGSFLSSSNPVGAFLAKMNGLCRKLKLNDTVFRNPHGMSTSINLSSAKSVAIFTLYGLKIPVFCKIIATYSYSCVLINGNDVRKLTWINTNRLLRKGFCGVKTGFTPAAGPCLCTYIEQRNKRMLIVMLTAKTMQSRFTEASKLWKWANAHILI